MLQEIPSMVPNYIGKILQRLNLLKLKNFYDSVVMTVKFVICPSPAIIGFLIDQLYALICSRGLVSEITKKLGRGDEWWKRIKIAVYNQICRICYFIMLCETNPQNYYTSRDYIKFYGSDPILTLVQYWLDIRSSSKEYFKIPVFGLLGIFYLSKEEPLGELLSYCFSKAQEIDPNRVNTWSVLSPPYNDKLATNDLLTLRGVMPDFGYKAYVPSDENRFHLPIGEIVTYDLTKESKDSGINIFDVDGITTFSIALNVVFCTQISSWDVLNYGFEKFYWTYNELITKTFGINTNIHPINHINPQYWSYLTEIAFGIAYTPGSNLGDGTVEPPGSQPSGPTPQGPVEPVSPVPSAPTPPKGNKPVDGKGKPPSGKVVLEPKPTYTGSGSSTSTASKVILQPLNSYPITDSEITQSLNEANSITSFINNEVGKPSFGSKVRNVVNAIERGLTIANQFKSLIQNGESRSVVTNTYNSLNYSTQKYLQNNPMLQLGYNPKLQLEYSPTVSR